MADPHAPGDHDYQRGSQDISEQASTFDLVMGLTKWGSLGTVAVILFTLLILSTGNFLTAFGSAAALTVVGVFALKSKSAH